MLNGTEERILSTEKFTYIKRAFRDALRPLETDFVLVSTYKLSLNRSKGIREFDMEKGGGGGDEKKSRLITRLAIWLHCLKKKQSVERQC